MDFPSALLSPPLATTRLFARLDTPSAIGLSQIAGLAAIEATI